jgi:hypothetical protein
MFDWWADLGKPAQYGICLAVLGFSVFEVVNGVFRPWTWAVGIVLFGFAVLGE